MFEFRNSIIGASYLGTDCCSGSCLGLAPIAHIVLYHLREYFFWTLKRRLLAENQKVCYQNQSSIFKIFLVVTKLVFPGNVGLYLKTKWGIALNARDPKEGKPKS
jgi:hypothetical protein